MAFKIWYYYFKYQVIFFGLSNTTATFKRYVNKILAKKLDIFIIVYLNNILIYTKNLGQSHIEDIYWVLNQLQKHFFFVNLKKYRFYQNEVYFLKYMVSSKKISIETKKSRL